MTNQRVQKNPLFNPGTAVTTGAVEAKQLNRPTVTLIYINMPAVPCQYCEEAAL